MEPNPPWPGEEHEDLSPPSGAGLPSAGFEWQENSHGSLIDWEGGSAVPGTQEQENESEPSDSQTHGSQKQVEDGAGEGNPQMRRAACLVCRQRKVRCSRHKPSCERCVRFGRKCVYGVPGVAGRKPIPQVLKDVRSRLYRVESLLGQQISTQDINSQISMAMAIMSGEENGQSTTENSSSIPGDRPNAAWQPEPVDPLSSTAQNIHFDLPRAPVAVMTGQLDSKSVDSSGVNTPIQPTGFLPFSDRNAEGAIVDYDMSDTTDNNMTLFQDDSSNNKPLTWETSNWSDPLPLEFMQFIDTSMVEPADVEVRSHRLSTSTTPSTYAITPPASLSSAIASTLEQLYFDKVSHSVPMIDQIRFRTMAANGSNATPEFTSLRFAIQMHGALVSEEYANLHSYLYERSRNHLESISIDDTIGNMMGVEMVQAWTLNAVYEFKQTLFSRAWMSTGKASRLALMLGLHRIDIGDTLGGLVDTLPPAQDWAQVEERRRTFWCIFNLDRYSFLGVGWPMSIAKSDIATNMPSPNEYYAMQSPPPGISFQDGMKISSLPTLCPFARVVFMADLCARYVHLSKRAMAKARDDHDYWLEHYHHDKDISEIAATLGDFSRRSPRDPNMLFASLNSQCSIICLHQSVIYRLRTSGGSEAIIADSEKRCLGAGLDIANSIRMIYQKDLTTMNFFLDWALFLGIKVILRHLQSGPADTAILEAKSIMFNALRSLEKNCPLTQLFISFLQEDLAGVSSEMAVSWTYPFLPKKGITSPNSA